jgi:hypothetical protein
MLIETQSDGSIQFTAGGSVVVAVDPTVSPGSSSVRRCNYSRPQFGDLESVEPPKGHGTELAHLWERRVGPPQRGAGSQIRRNGRRGLTEVRC